MKRVTGIGGIFFKSPNSEVAKEWYKQHLGIDAGDYGAVFNWRGFDNPEEEGLTTWSIFKEETKYLDPSQSRFMINYRVEDLHALVAALGEEGVTLAGEVQESEFGRFAWVMDPDGNKIELWEPPKESEPGS